MFNLPLCNWSSQLFDLRAPLSTDVPVLLLNQPNSEFTQQDGRKKRTAKQLCVTNVTRLLPVGFVVRKVKFGEKLFQIKLLSRLSHKVCRILSSPVLLRKFTNITHRTHV